MIMLDLAVMPRWLQWTFPLLTWRGPNRERSLYLTFDDGPTPGATEPVLDLLAEYKAQATFFCLGQSVRAAPHLLQRIADAGHTIGNHGFAHLNGWSTPTANYLADVEGGQAELIAAHGIKTSLFRPPYGRIGIAQWMRLRADYQCVLWEVNSQDYRQDLPTPFLIDQTLSNTRCGSILLFHDSERAIARTLPILKAVLDHFSSSGYVFQSLKNAASSD